MPIQCGGGDDAPAGGGTAAQMVSVSSERFSIAWDAPDGEVESYDLYYREHGTEEWLPLGAVGADTLQFEVSDATLPDGYGLYDFAVRSVEATGETSEYHTSLDETAQPQTGWYVDWTAPS